MAPRGGLPEARNGCVQLIERPARRAGWVRQLLPGEIPGSPVWVTALDEVRRYRTADFYADDLEETQRYVKGSGPTATC